MEWIERVVEHPAHEQISRTVASADGHPSPRWTAAICALYCFQTPRRCTTRFRPFISPMKIRYFQDTDTLYIEFRAAQVAETRDLDENTLLDVDAEGNICGITVEHAQKRVEDIPHVSFEQVAV
jgi:uncharacterized protein YuzE